MLDTANIITAVLSHPSSADRSPEELGREISQVLSQRRLLASSVNPLSLLIDPVSIFTLVQDRDSEMFDQFGITFDQVDELLGILENDPEIIDEAIMESDPEFDRDNMTLDSLIDDEVYRAEVEITGIIIGKVFGKNS